MHKSKEGRGDTQELHGADAHGTHGGPAGAVKAETAKAQKAEMDKAFGVETANGIFDELLKQFGPLLGQLIMKWLLSRSPVTDQVRASAPKATEGKAHTQTASHQVESPGALSKGLLSGDNLRAWLASILRDNKEQILAFVMTELSEIYDGAVNLVNPQSAVAPMPNAAAVPGTPSKATEKAPSGDKGTQSADPSKGSTPKH